MAAVEQMNQALEEVKNATSNVSIPQGPSGGALSQGFNLMLILMANEIQWLQQNQANVLEAIENASSVGFSQYQAEFDKADPMMMSGVMDAIGSALGAVVGLTQVAYSTIANRPNVSNMTEIKGKIASLKSYDDALGTLSKTTQVTGGNSDAAAIEARLAALNVPTGTAVDAQAQARMTNGIFSLESRNTPELMNQFNADKAALANMNNDQLVDVKTKLDEQMRDLNTQFSSASQAMTSTDTQSQAWSSMTKEAATAITKGIQSGYTHKTQLFTAASTLYQSLTQMANSVTNVENQQSRAYLDAMTALAQQMQSFASR